LAKSRTRLKNSQQPKDPVFFLDRQLGAYKLPAILRAAGFIVVTHLERYGSQRDTEPDPSIAIECGKQKNVLITADPDFEHTYGAEILAAKIAVFYLVNNHDGADKWGARILGARTDILRELGRRRKPFVAHVTTEGIVNQVKLYYRKKTKVIRIAKKRATEAT
jgi:hypothetical protein